MHLSHHTAQLLLQVHSMTEKLAQSTDIRTALVVGGLSIQVQASTLKTSPEIVVATPVSRICCSWFQTAVLHAACCLRSALVQSVTATPLFPVGCPVSSFRPPTDNLGVSSPYSSCVTILPFGLQLLNGLRQGRSDPPAAPAKSDVPCRIPYPSSLFVFFALLRAAAVTLHPID